MTDCSKCKNLYNLTNEDGVIEGKWCPEINDSPDIERERECEHFKPMSNADRIRAMSDEELAEFLPIVSNMMCQVTSECIKYVCNHGECTKTTECALKWLQSEAE